LFTINAVTGCHEWQGLRNGDGYGLVCIDHKHLLVHRVAWILNRGPIPKSWVVMQRCDNPRCMNVDHLEAGTNRQNTADMVTKRRHAHGERHGKRVLTEEQAREIKISKDGGLDLAERYGVSPATICKIRRGQLWRHL